MYVAEQELAHTLTQKDCISMVIYKITNILTLDFYVGKTVKTLKQRFSNHKAFAKRESKTHLHRAINKYGSENFVIESVEENILNEKSLNEREIFWINKLSPRYNMTFGGEGGLIGYKHSQITKYKISKSHIGKQHSQQSKLKMSESSKKENLTSETLLKLKKPKKKVVCRLCDRKEMTFGHFMLWNLKFINNLNQIF